MLIINLIFILCVNLYILPILNLILLISEPYPDVLVQFLFKQDRICFSCKFLLVRVRAGWIHVFSEQPRAGGCGADKAIASVRPPR